MRNKNTTPRAAFNPDRSHDASCITRINSVCECNCSKAAELDVERFDEVTGGYDDIDHARAAKRLNADLRAMDATPRGKHTPGPWKVSRNRCDVDNVNGAGVCAMYADETSDANARLIAAAPDMLEALQDILLDMAANESNGLTVKSARDWASVNRARAAIARATR